MGVDQVSLDLLDDQENDDKPERLHGVYHEDQKRPHETADKGPKNWNQGQEANEHADHQRVGQPEDQHDYHKHGAQDHRFSTLTGHKAAESAVGQAEDL